MTENEKQELLKQVTERFNKKYIFFSRIYIILNFICCLLGVYLIYSNLTQIKYIGSILSILFLVLYIAIYLEYKSYYTEYIKNNFVYRKDYNDLLNKYNKLKEKN